MAKIYDKAKALADRIPNQELLGLYFKSLTQDLHQDDLQFVIDKLLEEVK